MKEVEEGHYSNGQLMFRYNYLNHKLHGLVEWWLINSELEYRYNFINGKQCGLYEGWNRNGVQNTKHYRLL